jgi:hypothetical protein
MVTEERIIEIMEGEYGEINVPDKTMHGLKLLSQYTKGEVIEGAGHDEIWLTNISEAIEKGITEEACIELRQLGFLLDGDNEYFIKFV